MIATAAVVAALGWAVSPPPPPKSDDQLAGLTHVPPAVLARGLPQPVSASGASDPGPPVLPYFSQRRATATHLNADGTLAGVPIRPARRVALCDPPKPQCVLGRYDVDLDEQVRARTVPSAQSNASALNFAVPEGAHQLVRRPDPQQAQIDLASLPVTSLTTPASAQSRNMRMDRRGNADGPAFGVCHNESLRSSQYTTRLPEQAEGFAGRFGPMQGQGPDRNTADLLRGMPSPFAYMPVPLSNAYIDRLTVADHGHGVIQAQPFEGAEVRARHYAVNDLGNRCPNPTALVDDGLTLVPDVGLSPLVF